MAAMQRTSEMNRLAGIGLRTNSLATESTSSSDCLTQERDQSGTGLAEGRKLTSMQVSLDIWLPFRWVPRHIVVDNHIDGHYIDTSSNDVCRN